MKVTLQESIETEAGQAPIVERIAYLERAGLDPSTLGLTLSEAKGLLARVQAVMVTQQVAAYVEPQRICLETGFSVISVRSRFRKTEATDTLKSMHMCFSQRKLRLLSA